MSGVLDCPIAETEFAVLDLETTGFSPRRHDRIVEVAVVRVTSDGRQIDQFSTLINPQRDLGPTDVHGIRGEQVLDAPTFDQIVGDLADRCRDAVLVAHNAAFDMRFLVAEMNAAGYRFDDPLHLCTMRMARQLIPGLDSYRLAACCEELELDLDNAHAAAADAAATASVLAALLLETDAASRLGDLPHRGRLPQWPAVSASGLVATRCGSEKSPQTAGYLAHLVGQLAGDVVAARDDDCDAYLDAVSRALEDRILSVDEADGLADLAEELGLAAETVFALHREFWHRLAVEAWRDEVVTETERHDLCTVAKLLSLSEEQMVDAEVAAKAEAERIRQSGQAAAAPQSLDFGTVCFSGQLAARLDGERMTRSRAKELAAERGLEIKSGVSKKLDVLVLADPFSQSSKARKAREAGTRILSEVAFWRLLGIEVE